VRNKKAWGPSSIRELARSRLKEADAVTDKWEGTPKAFRSSHLSSGSTNASESEIDHEASLKGLRTQADSHEFHWGNYQEAVGNRVFVIVPGTEDDEGEEIEQLCRTLGLEAVESELLNPKRRFDSATYLGTGTLEELRDRMRRLRCTALVVDARLSPVQVRNMERILEGPVVDREGVILSIFERHAQTRLAKMQVELAQLKYLQPRLTGMWMGLSRQSGGRGGRGGRGLGETRLELDRRVIKNRIASLAKKLKGAEKSLAVQSRRRSGLPRVALVGYTNAGKSTLMRKLTGSDVEARNSLFSTLDTTVRPLSPPTDPKILVSDTVGFVKNLPHALVASFKSTLSEALESRILLHVLDASHLNWKSQFDTTESVLKEIGGDKISRILVMNKIDQLGPAARLRLVEIQRHAKKYENYVAFVSLSALTGQGLALLRSELISECGVELPEWSHA
jgi:GTP-binding protein HflX